MLYRAMHTQSIRFDDLTAGVPIGPFELTVSPAANERYWRAAGGEHPALSPGAPAPPRVAAPLTVLAFQAHCPEAMIQTRQRLVCHRRAPAGTALTVTGSITDRYVKRGRTYVDVEVTVTAADGPTHPLWPSGVTFTPAAGL